MTGPLFPNPGHQIKQIPDPHKPISDPQIRLPDSSRPHIIFTESKSTLVTLYLSIN